MAKEFFNKGDKLMRDNSEFVRRESERISKLSEIKNKEIKRK